jgi:hypothetical protein
MLVMIDNFDSFTYNLFQYLMQLGAEVRVTRNNSLTLEELEVLSPRGLVISPGPGRPEDAWITVAAIRRFSGRIFGFDGGDTLGTTGAFVQQALQLAIDRIHALAHPRELAPALARTYLTIAHACSFSKLPM